MIIEVATLGANTYSTTAMLNGQKIVVVMPAYNAARTLQRTYDEVMGQRIVDLVIVVDDASHDETVAIAQTLPNVRVEVHPENRGYGGNQKTCYRLALAAGAEGTTSSGETQSSGAAGAAPRGTAAEPAAPVTPSGGSAPGSSGG